MMTDDRYYPPGYYVPDPSTGLCGHCDEPEPEHTTDKRFCPRLPTALRRPLVHEAAA